MGRDVTGIKSDKNSDVKSHEVPFDRVHAAPMTSKEEVEPKQELIADDDLNRAVNEELQENQEMSTIESTNIEAATPDGSSAITEALKPTEKFSVKPFADQEAIEAGTPDGSAMIEEMKPTEKKSSVKPSPDTDASESMIASPLEAPSLDVSSDKIDSGISIANEVEINSTSISPLLEKNDLPPVTDKNDSAISNASEVEINSTSIGPPPEKNDLPPVTDKNDSAISNASEVEINSPRISPPPEKNDLPPVTDKIDSGISNASQIKIDSTSNNSPLRKKNDLPPVTAKTKQPRSPVMSAKSLQSDTDENHHNEEDNISLASSAGSSVRSSKFKITVPVAPKFVCGDRVERRKEFYKRREEKQKALETERREYEAKLKEEEQGAIKQLRKSMSYKANPVPKFYQEGPPPKAKLKKLPLTRPKSPNLSRRKSCSDAFNSARDGKRNLF